MMRVSSKASTTLSLILSVVFFVAVLFGAAIMPVFVNIIVSGDIISGGADIFPKDKLLISRMVSTLENDEDIAVVYARQEAYKYCSTIESYTRYQKTVISDFNNLANLIAKAKEIKKIAKSSKTIEIIDERLKYLKQLKENKLLNISGVKESIDMAQEINQGEIGQEGPSNG